MSHQPLKFADVLARTGIDRWTAQYVLKHPDLLHGMPSAGSQGVHRVFDLDQAIRLAICTDLVKGGIALELAGAAVEYCERRFRTWSGSKDKSSGFFVGSVNNPWIIEVLNHDLVRLFKTRFSSAEIHPAMDYYHSTKLGKLVGEEPEVIRTRYQIDATAIRQMLEGTR